MDIKRLGIIAIFCSDGKIEPATRYLISSIANVVEDFGVIINGIPNEDVLEEVKCVTKNVHARENTGYDSGAFKYAMNEILGWNEIYKYQELVLVNDSCFGPIYSLENMFYEMADRNCDFWGVTDQPEIKRGRFSDSLIPYHIQSYFIVIRERMLKSQEFMDFWKQIKLADVYELAVDNFELAFTEYFRQRGYKADAYIDGREFCKSVEETQAYVFFDSFRLIKEYKCPLLKRKVFLFPEQDILASNAGETARKTLEYIEKETAYDVDLIWDYLIKKSDLYELKSILHLVYICSKKMLRCEKELDDPIGIIVFACSDEMENRCKEYAKELGEKFHLHVISQKEEKEVSEALYKRALENYKYVCVICEEEKIHEERAKEMYVRTLLEHAIGSYVYVRNVLELFRENKRLGILALPKPFIPAHFIGSFENDLRNGFWARTASLQGTGDIVCTVKENGYYMGEVFTEEDASVFVTDYAYTLNDLIRNFVLEHGVEEFRYLFCINKDLMAFTCKYEKIYVYGAGEYGAHCIQFLEENRILIQGVIVSEGMKRGDSFLSFPVYEFPEIERKEDLGIIVALNEKNTQSVIEMLQTQGFINYISFSE